MSAERDELLGRYMDAEEALRCASNWARLLAAMASHSGCHLAAVKRYERTESNVVSARHALDDYDYAPRARERAFHLRLVRNLAEAHGVKCDA